MSVQLTFLVCGGTSRDFNYAHCMLVADGSYEFYETVHELKSHDVPRDVGCYLARGDDGEPRYGDLPDTDPYGGEYRMVLAGDLAKLESDDYWPKAAIAYVRELQPDTFVILHWH